MIRHTFVIWEHDWIVRTYFAVNGYWADEILGHLYRIGADMDVMRSAARNLRSGKLNTGLTYTSRWNREIYPHIRKLLCDCCRHKSHK